MNCSDLLPYQLEGVDAIVANDSLYLGDDPGLGKTAQVIRACARLKPSTVLIVCPASLRKNWEREWTKWEGPDCKLFICSYQEAVKDCQGKPPRKGAEQIGILKRVWDVVAFDEAHALKTSGGKTQRAKSGLIYNIWKVVSEDEMIPDKWIRKHGVNAKRSVFLSGTPVLNRPVDIFPVLRHMEPNVWKSKTRFEQRYCNGHVDRYGRWDASGHSNLRELRDILSSSGIFIRRRKKDVLKDLPAKRRQLLVMDASKKETKLIDNILDTKILTDVTADLAWESNALKEYDNDSLEHIAEMRKKLGNSKTKPVVEFLIDQDKLGVLPSKLVIFAHHREVIENVALSLNEAKIKSSIYYGGMDDQQKDKVVQDFQHGDVRVFVGSIISAGVGLTLTAADTALVIEPSYVPAENVQAEDRLHRIGAKGSVLIQYVAVSDTLDVRILELVIQKMRMFDELFD